MAPKPTIALLLFALFAHAAAESAPQCTLDGCPEDAHISLIQKQVTLLQHGSVAKDSGAANKSQGPSPKQVIKEVISVAAPKVKKVISAAAPHAKEIISAAAPAAKKIISAAAPHAKEIISAAAPVAEKIIKKLAAAHDHQSSDESCVDHDFLVPPRAALTGDPFTTCAEVPRAHCTDPGHMAACPLSCGLCQPTGGHSICPPWEEVVNHYNDHPGKITCGCALPNTCQLPHMGCKAEPRCVEPGLFEEGPDGTLQPAMPPPMPQTMPPTMPPQMPPPMPQTMPPTMPPQMPPPMPPTMPPTMPPQMPPPMPQTMPPTMPPQMPQTMPPTVPPAQPPQRRSDQGQIKVQKRRCRGSSAKRSRTSTDGGKTWGPWSQCPTTPTTTESPADEWEDFE